MAMLIAATSFAQQKSVKGQVKDETGQPIPGVSIIIKGTTNGTTSDFDGFYDLKGTYDSRSIIQFSYIGMTTLEKVVGTSNEINAVLRENLETLNEVVVVGYGSQEKKVGS